MLLTDDFFFFFFFCLIYMVLAAVKEVTSEPNQVIQTSTYNICFEYHQPFSKVL